jgi:AraC-like DNA-binding protein
LIVQGRFHSMTDSFILCVSVHTVSTECSANDKRPADAFRITILSSKNGDDRDPFHERPQHFTVHLPSVGINAPDNCSGKAQIMATRLAEFLLDLYKEFSGIESVSSGAIESPLAVVEVNLPNVVPAWLERARNILHDRFDEQAKLSEIARAVGVHPVHLARQFRKYYGSSVGEYLRQLRIEFACHQLLASDDPSAKIATSAGFNDQSHFCRTFKRLRGTTPGKFRTALKSGASTHTVSKVVNGSKYRGCPNLRSEI